jgi:F-type H+-transporting ATPase subunit b
VKRAWFPLAALLVLSAGAVRAEDHPTLTEPVSGSFDHEPSQTGVAPATGEPTSGHATEHATSHGEHGEHAGVDAKTLALQLLNFGVLLFILIWFGGRALSKAFRSRHNQLKSDIESAANQRALAEQRFREQDARFANLEQELAALRAAVKEEGMRERVRLLAGADEKAKRIQDETRFQLDQQIKEAELRLRAEVASTAVKVADELLKRSVNADDERRLAQDFAAGAGAPTEVVR